MPVSARCAWGVFSHKWFQVRNGSILADTEVVCNVEDSTGLYRAV